MNKSDIITKLLFYTLLVIITGLFLTMLSHNATERTNSILAAPIAIFGILALFIRTYLWPKKVNK